MHISRFARLVLLVLALLPVSAAHAEWVTSWSAAPVQTASALEAVFPAPSYENRTLRQTIRLSAGGNAIRVRLSNQYGDRPLKIGGMRIALLDAEGNIVADSIRTVLFGGEEAATVARGAPLLSDVVTLDLPDLARLTLLTYLPEATGPCTCHMTGIDEMQISPPGNFLGQPFEAEARGTQRAFVAAVEVDAAQGVSTIAMMADSITDGIGSTPGANKRWPDQLADRFHAAGLPVPGIANQGISGNRVLGDGFGESALARLDRDILALVGVKVLIVFEGINDIGVAFGPPSPGGPTPFDNLGGPPVTAGSLIAAYRQIVTRAHLAGVRVLGATIAPYRGSARYSEEGEAVRQQVNEAIRSGGIFDGVLDFDLAFRDPANPQAILDGYHMGDFLHGSDKGYRAVAESVAFDLLEP